MDFRGIDEDSAQLRRPPNVERRVDNGILLSFIKDFLKSKIKLMLDIKF